ncbi:Anthocyanidin 3-O-glucosyltransferase [Hordeum vulgare]|nr:Anthocyanidin 3-O-glucosyltransferase [Hordeum vulgare]KAI4996998.1 hypothetical protein ZWY2020_052340 [Hordeum vulgare]
MLRRQLPLTRTSLECYLVTSEHAYVLKVSPLFLPRVATAWVDRNPSRAAGYANFDKVVTPLVGRREELPELAGGMEAYGPTFLLSLLQRF